jgi:hypothetical protein
VETPSIKSYSGGAIIVRGKAWTPSVRAFFAIRRRVVMLTDAPAFNLDAKLDTSTAAQAARVAEHVIRTWRTRGWLDPDGNRRKLPVVDHDWRGRPLHRLGDVLQAERETRTSGRSFRRCPPPHDTDWASLDEKDD